VFSDFYFKGYDDEGILLEGNYIVSPPPEVLKQGKASLLDWFKAEKSN